jgi:alkylation response protein AidB-like acyl-CoA dehydrogenase
MTEVPSMSTQEQVRARLRAWLTENWDPGLSLAQWRARLADSGWGRPAWPQEWLGLGLPESLAAVVYEELRQANVVGVASGSGMALAAPTLLAHGSDELKRRLLRGTLTGEYRWCQLFSEPGSGSDLAGLTTRAVPDGNRWRVSGQKLWTTSAHHARYAMLLARTDRTVPKHHGITYFVLDMRQPGVEVRPLRQMNGYASFNEVFLDDVIVGPDDVVGGLNDGWRVARTTLLYERTAQIDTDHGIAGVGRVYDEAAEERRVVLEPYVWYPARSGRADLVAQRARAAGRGADPVVRQEVARVEALRLAVEWTRERAAAASVAGGAPGPEGSVGKLASTQLARAASAAHSLIAGTAGLKWDPADPAGHEVAEIVLSVPGGSIAGGTDQIQRTIIGERVLGLPKEPATGHDVPFSRPPVQTT